MQDNLSQTAYFKGLNEAGLRRVWTVAHVHVYQAGALIFAEGMRCSGFFVLLEGSVRVFRVGHEGRLHTLNLLRPISTFNEVSAVDGRVNPFNATALTDSRVLIISRTHLLRLMSDEPTLLSNYVQQLAQMNRDYLERLEDMTFRSIPSRLAKLLLHETTYADQIAETPTKLTQEEIAAILGTTREVVGRAVRGLLVAGLLKKRGRELYIQDRDGLEYLSVNNELPPKA